MWLPNRAALVQPESVGSLFPELPSAVFYIIMLSCTGCVDRHFVIINQFDMRQGSGYASVMLGRVRRPFHILLATTLSLLFLLVIWSLGGCHRMVHQSIAVKDTSTPEKIMIQKSRWQGNVHAIKIRIHGEIRGNAVIQLMLNEESYKEARLQGVVDVEWSGDWYADDAEIQYTPLSNPGGHLQIGYEFRSF